MSKYKSVKTMVGNEVFDSKKEAERYLDLRKLEDEGKIKNLQRQVRFSLIPKQTIDGKVVERECSYIADFVYMENGRMVVEDAKGVQTPEFRLKKKLMLWVHGIRLRMS